jgi:hypothetical protein
MDKWCAPSFLRFLVRSSTVQSIYNRVTLPCLQRANARGKGWVDSVNFRDLTQRHLIEPFRIDAGLCKPATSQQYQSYLDTTGRSQDVDDNLVRANIQTSPVEVNITQYGPTNAD